MGQHAWVTLRPHRTGSLLSQSQLIGFVRTAEVSMRVNHARLVEHLQLSTRLLVFHTLHEGL